MTRLTYEVERHDGGWAYRVGNVFSEIFPTHDEARRAAKAAADRQELEGAPADIEYEDAGGTWHREHTSGEDHPDTTVRDRSRRN